MMSIATDRMAARVAARFLEAGDDDWGDIYGAPPKPKAAEDITHPDMAKNVDAHPEFLRHKGRIRKVKRLGRALRPGERQSAAGFSAPPKEKPHWTEPIGAASGAPVAKGIRPAAVSKADQRGATPESVVNARVRQARVRQTGAGSAGGDAPAPGMPETRKATGVRFPEGEGAVNVSHSGVMHDAMSLDDQAAGVVRKLQQRQRQEEVTPPGGEDVVRALKDQPGVENPWAVAWSMKGKGYKPFGKGKGRKEAAAGSSFGALQRPGVIDLNTAKAIRQRLATNSALNLYGREG